MRDQTIESRPACEESPEPQAAAHDGARQVALKLALAPEPHQLRQWNPHRADFLTPATECRCVWQVAGFIDSDQTRRKHRAHGSRVDPAICVTTNRLIHGAVVHAGSAANAAKHVAEFAG